MALSMQLPVYMRTENVQTALRTRIVKVDYISLADLRALIKAGFMVIFVQSPYRGYK